MVALLQSFYVAPVESGIFSWKKKWESKIQLAQKQILKKARKDILVNGSCEGIEKY
jgi:hypothetical protein